MSGQDSESDDDFRHCKREESVENAGNFMLNKAF